MRLSIVDNLDSIPADAWNGLAGDANPFLRHQFLAALERHGCVGPRFGWLPRHLVMRDGDHLVGAVPLYLKDNSYGEFVFDWAWADAYRRAGLDYYPKLVASIPYAPVTGPRLLLADVPERELVAQGLIQGALDYARKLGVSSLHWLFTHADDSRRLHQQGLMLRQGCQFHWHNPGHGDFDEFLATLTSKKRKQIRRERRLVREAGVVIEVRSGHEIGDGLWEVFQRFYASTFAKKSGYPTLNLDFFREIGQTMAQNVVLVVARHNGRYVAGALNLRGANTLYGRHWGCVRDFHSLHFEVCYYRAIEYCIEHGLARFEAGAQGEHKLSRGFLPVSTWSAHWLADADFNQALRGFLEREKEAMQDYMQVLTEHSPYRALGHADCGSRDLKQPSG